MTQLDIILNSLPDDIAIKIASSLQVSELCSLGSCSRFWRELCKSDCLWESLAKQRWPFLGLLEPSSSSSSINITEWRGFYIERHSEMGNRAEKVVNFMEESESIESGDYLKAITDLFAMQLGFKDIEMFLLSPKLNSLLNLVGLHYSISWLRVPGEIVADIARQRGISERQICVKWWKLGRWFYGFRMRDESRSRQLSLADLVGPAEAEVLRVLTRGAVHEVLRIQISSPDPSPIPWHCLNAQAQD